MDSRRDWGKITLIRSLALANLDGYIETKAGTNWPMSGVAES